MNKPYLALTFTLLIAGLSGCEVDNPRYKNSTNFEYSGAYGNGLTSQQIAEADARFKRGAERRAAGETLESSIAQANRANRTTSTPVRNTNYCTNGFQRGADGNCHFVGTATASGSSSTGGGQGSTFHLTEMARQPVQTQSNSPGCQYGVIDAKGICRSKPVPLRQPAPSSESRCVNGVCPTVSR